MTEAEWFTSTDALAMLAHLGAGYPERKLQLFACRCLQALGDELPFESAECVKYVEKYTDGLLPWRDVINRVTTRTLEPNVPLLRWLPIHLVAESAHAAAEEAVFWVISRHHPEVKRDWQLFLQTWGRGRPNDRGIEVDSRTLAPLLRDVVGNPFRPVGFRAEWRTETAVLLARRMYVSRDFGAMPILADALQDAGCDADELLAHCRDPEAVHVRGCWAVDLVLGKS